MKLTRPTCAAIRDLLPLHVGNDLEPHKAALVDGHLQGCTTCFREFRDLSSMRGLLGVLAEQRLPAGILDGFTEEVMARIAIGERGPAAAPPRSGAILRLMTWQRAAAAAAMLMVSVAAWRLIDDPAGAVPAIDTVVPAEGAPIAASGEASRPGTPWGTSGEVSTPAPGHLLQFGALDRGGIGVVSGGSRATTRGAPVASTPSAPFFVLMPQGRVPTDVDRILSDMARTMGPQTVLGSGLMFDYEVDGSLRQPRPRDH